VGSASRRGDCLDAETEPSPQGSVRPPVGAGAAVRTTGGPRPGVAIPKVRTDNKCHDAGRTWGILPAGFMDGGRLRRGGGGRIDNSQCVAGVAPLMEALFRPHIEGVWVQHLPHTPERPPTEPSIQQLGVASVTEIASHRQGWSGGVVFCGGGPRPRWQGTLQPARRAPIRRSRQRKQRPRCTKGSADLTVIPSDPGMGRQNSAVVGGDPERCRRRRPRRRRSSAFGFCVACRFKAGAFHQRFPNGSAQGHL